MRRWLLCLGVCCAISACDGSADTQDEESGQPASTTGGTSPTTVMPTATTAATRGIGDGETGTNGNRATSGTVDPATASAGGKPSGPAAPVVVAAGGSKAPTATPSTSSAAGAPTSGGGMTVSAGAATSAPTDEGSSDDSASGDSTTSVSSGPSHGAVVPSTSAVSSSTQGTAQSGTLTAGTWDDNRNFERFTAYRADPARKSLPGVLPLTDDELSAAHAAFSQPATARAQLDVALVIDTTGSMGDELSYLQTEFVAISRAIESKYPNAAQRWALVLYKDVGDEYLTRYFDFRTDAEEFRQKLAAQSAGGGGDFPESPEAAFEMLNQLGWRADASVAKLAFWVADAPHHNQNAAKFAETLRTAHAQSIHVYPVASSGVDDLTELTMRSAAQLTGGRYMFLTSDSGVGGAHKEPSIPCYFVTKLDDALLRMVDIELSGSYREPEAAKVLRAAGDPKAGICTLASGQIVQVY